MGKAPAVIIIARHGARLDAENPEWHTTSPTPYDTPLTYGGWIQTRALGARIASLLHARQQAQNADRETSRRKSTDSADTSTAPRATSTSRTKQKKQRVIVHSSPFVRCIQSSIAVSAGIAQYEGNLARFDAASNQPPRPSSPPMRSHTLDPRILEERYSSGSDGTTARNKPTSPQQQSRQTESKIEKTALRVDAFLGEWLSTDYFEFITPPPSSNMMVAGAKAELLISAEPLQGSKVESPDASFPAGLGTVTSASLSGPLASLNAIATALPSEAAEPDESGAGKSPERIEKPKKELQSSHVGYVPPTPTYALLASDPIPTGYVAHARDACVNIDFQWDSMYPPQQWGDGGEHGEEWSAMHNRFRQGLRSLVTWYRFQDASYEPKSDNEKPSRQDGANDEDEELVVVIVTHGAGCNALIGALTNQPVLMDVGMASLTMAVEKDRGAIASGAPPANTGVPRRRSSVDTGLSQEYDLQLIASTDHLRAGADPLKIPQLQSPFSMPSIPELGRNGRSGFSTPSTPGSMTPTELDRPRHKNTALGSIRRTNVQNKSRSNTQTSQASVSSSAAGGLWGGAGSRKASVASIVADEELPPSPTSDMLPNFDDSKMAPSEQLDNYRTALNNATLAGGGGGGLQRSGSARGLWGAPQPPSRGSTSRRSTMSEQG